MINFLGADSGPVFDQYSRKIRVQLLTKIRAQDVGLTLSGEFKSFLHIGAKIHFALIKKSICLKENVLKGSVSEIELTDPFNGVT